MKSRPDKAATSYSNPLTKARILLQASSNSVNTEATGHMAGDANRHGDGEQADQGRITDMEIRRQEHIEHGAHARDVRQRQQSLWQQMPGRRHVDLASQQAQGSDMYRTPSEDS